MPKYKHDVDLIDLSIVSDRLVYCVWTNRSSSCATPLEVQFYRLRSLFDLMDGEDFSERNPSLYRAQENRSFSERKQRYTLGSGPINDSYDVVLLRTLL